MEQQNIIRHFMVAKENAQQRLDKLDFYVSALQTVGIGCATDINAEAMLLLEHLAVMGAMFEKLLPHGSIPDDDVAVLPDVELKLPLIKQLLELETPENRVLLNTIIERVKIVQEDLYQTRIRAEHAMSELHFARDYCTKHSIDMSGDHGVFVHYGIERLTDLISKLVDQNVHLTKPESMKTFIIEWTNGSKDELRGFTEEHAILSSGLGVGALANVKKVKIGE